ncbi:MAG: dephospho-CoA kinase, partial [Ignavibacteriaceae bacterium]
VISADDISKKILAGDKVVKEKIIKAFGAESFRNGEINKKYLAGKIFPDPANVVKVNSILHPKVIKETEILLNNHLKDNDLVFVEAALIYEADMEFLFDYVVLITADEKIRMRRKVIPHNGITEQDFIKRNENQIPDEEKKKRADFVFINNGTIDELKIKADFLILTLKGLLKVND